LEKELKATIPLTEKFKNLSPSILGIMVNESLSRLHVVNAFSQKELLLTLRGCNHYINTHKKIKLLVIDSLNAYDFDFGKPEKKPNPTKRKKKNAIKKAKMFSKLINKQILEAIDELKRAHKTLALIVTQVDYFRAKETVSFVRSSKKVEINHRMGSLLSFPTFPHSRKVYMTNAISFNEDFIVDFANQPTHKEFLSHIGGFENLRYIIYKAEDDNFFIVPYYLDCSKKAKFFFFEKFTVDWNKEVPMKFKESIQK